MYWIVMADKYWYKFDDIDDAKKQYNYIYDNKDGKYKNIDKLRLLEYNEFKMQKTLRIWIRPQEEEMEYEK